MKCLVRWIDGWSSRSISPKTIRQQVKNTKDEILLYNLYNHKLVEELSHTPDGFRLKCILHEIKTRKLLSK